MNFLEWQAAIACGATLTELLAWDRGDECFPVWFKAKVVARYNLNNSIALNSQDAAMKKRR